MRRHTNKPRTQEKRRTPQKNRTHVAPRDGGTHPHVQDPEREVQRERATNEHTAPALTRRHVHGGGSVDYVDLRGCAAPTELMSGPTDIVAH